MGAGALTQMAAVGGHRIGYFTVNCGALLLFVLLGFSRSFYLLPFGELEPLSGPLIETGVWPAFIRRVS